MEKSRIGDQVLYKNNQLIAFNKPATIPVQSDQTGSQSLLALGEAYCHHPLHLIHRLDRPATGVVLLAKNAKALAHLNEQFKNRTVTKTYLAVVKNRPPKEADQIQHFLMKNGTTNKTSVSNTDIKGTKEALLNYRVLGSSDHYHLLEIQLLTGRHHQVRAQLAAIKCPIKGDVKYGFRRANKDRSIHLHAWKLMFHHPVTAEQETIVAPPPPDPVWDAFRMLLAD